MGEQLCDDKIQKKNLWIQVMKFDKEMAEHLFDARI